MAGTSGRAALLEQNLLISQGSDNRYAFRYGSKETVDGPVTYPDLTVGWSARAQFRTRVGGEVWATLTDQQVDGSGIVLGPDGWVHVVLDHTLTEAPAWDKYKRGVWDLELVGPGGDPVTRMVMGQVTVSADVTREVVSA